MSTELIVFSGSQFVGKPTLIDIDFATQLQRVNDFAAAERLQVFVTSAARQHGVAVGGNIVPPASRSNHLVGHAIDMNLKLDGRLFNSARLKNSALRSQPSAVRNFIKAVRNEPGLRWGGDFEDEDPVHIDDGLNVRDSALWDAKFLIIQAELIVLTRPSAAPGEPRLLMLERPFMTGPDVMALQQRLVALGFEMNPDGSFGPLTDRAVTEFQRQHGLEADGIVRGRTRRALGLARRSNA